MFPSRIDFRIVTPFVSFEPPLISQPRVLWALFMGSSGTGAPRDGADPSEPKQP